MFGRQGTFKLYGRFFLEETVYSQSGEQDYQAIYRTAMPGMFYFTNIFQFVVNCFNNRTFSQKDFISYCHQAVFHIAFHTGNQMQSVFEKQFAQLVFDKFHLVKALNEAPEEVRRLEGKSNELLKNHRYTVLKKYEDLSLKKKYEPDARLPHYPKVGEAYRLIQLFLEVFDLIKLEEAKG